MYYVCVSIINKQINKNTRNSHEVCVARGKVRAEYGSFHNNSCSDAVCLVSGVIVLLMKYHIVLSASFIRVAIVTLC